MISKKFSCRKKKCRSDIKYNRKTTAVAILYQKEVIKINFNERKIFFRFNQYYSLFISETFEIVSCKNSICNDTASLFILRKLRIEFLHILFIFKNFFYWFCSFYLALNMWVLSFSN